MRKGLGKRKDDQIRKSMKGRAEKAAYDHRKEQVMEREKENDKLIILFRSNENWWKIAGNSVLYYTKLVAPRLKKSVKVWPDRDYVAPSKEGIVQVRDLKKFIDEVESLNYTIKPGTGEDYLAVELGYKVTQEELNTMVEEESRKWKMSDRMLMPAVIWPTIKTLLLEILRTMWEMTRKLDAVAQRAFGNELMYLVNDAIKALSLAAHERMESREALVQITDDVDEIEGLMLGATAIRIFSSEQNYNLATTLMKLKDAITKESNKIEKEERKRKRREKE